MPADMPFVRHTKEIVRIVRLVRDYGVDSISAPAFQSVGSPMVNFQGASQTLVDRNH